MQADKAYILALDQGTSSSRAILYDLKGSTVAQAQHTFDMSFPADGWVEQNPEVLWQTTLQSGRDVIAKAKIDAAEIACVGITNQRETTLLWERESGQCVYNAIVWQDRRTAQYCETLAQQTIAGLPAADYIAQHTGLVIDPYFSGTKLKWILDEVANARTRAVSGDLCFGTVDSYLIWKLTGGSKHVTDVTNASRTQLLDIHTLQFDDHLLSTFDIPTSVLPEVLQSADDFGVCDPQWFGAPIPITGVAGDQQAALVGQACFSPGMTKSTYGTGCFVMANTGNQIVQSSTNLLSTVAYKVAGETSYALEGSLFVAGVAIKWLRDNLGLIHSAQETEAAYINTGGDSGGVYVVPAFTGLGAPHWNPKARGTVTGLTLDSTRDQMITAFLQGVVFQTEELLSAMAQDGANVSSLRVDGGMVVNNALCQCLADVLNVDVQRPADVETTALGAALLAGLGQGIFADLKSAADGWQLEQAFSPQWSDDRRQQQIENYRRAVLRVL